MVVRGTDVLGQPFEETTSTISFNLHGCRYSSRYQLPRNTWITLEFPQNTGARAVRARVAWILEAQPAEEIFDIAVELESPANISETNLSAGEKAAEAPSTEPHAGSFNESPAQNETELRRDAENAEHEMSSIPRDPTEKTMNDTAHSTPESVFESRLDLSAAAESPLLRELTAELRRQAKEAVEAAASETTEQIRASIGEIERRRLETDRVFESWKEQLEKAQTDARAELAAHLGTERENLRAALISESESAVERIREHTQALDRRAEELRSESEATRNAINLMAQMRLQAELEELAKTTGREAEAPHAKSEEAENAAARWREILAAEMSIANGQWDELLQSSLDRNMHRLAAEISERSQAALRGAEKQIDERFTGLRQPLEQVSADAREAVGTVKAILEEEVSRARNSLAEIEQSAGRVKEYSAQLDAANHDTLNELHRRLESMLETQTEELHRRADRLAEDLPGRVTPSLESLTERYIERSVAGVESKLAPHFERIPELLREMASREMQAEDGLRLHRERLRQLSENNQREVSSQLAATLAGLNNDFDAAREEALIKCGEEMDASGLRASQAAAEAIGRDSEWFQQEARARLQVLVEQTVATAGTSFEEKTAEAAQKFEAELDGRSTARLARIEEQMNSAAGEATGHARSQMAEAAEIAAASFGEVLRGISSHEAEQFGSLSRDAMHSRAQELDGIAGRVVQNMDAAAGTWLDRFQTQMAAHVETSLVEGRAALASEFHSALEGYHIKRDAHQKDWAESLDRLTGEAAERYQERLESMSDTWRLASVRRLNEHGLNAIESLTRSADQSLRESCSRLFEDISAILRGRTAGPIAAAGFAAQTSHEAPDAPHASQ